MPEKYFFYISGATLLFILLFFAGVVFYARFRHLRRLAVINVLRRQQKAETPCFYATAVLQRAVSVLFYKSGREARTALAFLCGGRTGKVADYFRRRNPALSLLLAAHGKNLPEIYPKIIGKKTLLKKNPSFRIFAALIARTLFDENIFRALQQKVKISALPRYLRAYGEYAAAVCYLSEGDMLSASQQASAALDIFKKRNFIFEEAQTYLLLAEIYRISCVNDIAQTMIESAQKIFNRYALPLAEAGATASLGMLMLFENRYEESEDKLKKALTLSNRVLSADIKNQLALLKIAQKKHSEALQLVITTIKEHRKFQNRRGEALGRQLRSHLFSVQQNYAKAATDAGTAAKLYLEQDNISAYAECLYMKAAALCRLKKDTAAEKLLRNILELEQQHRLNFHIANVYSLLGLIYLQRKELPRARVLLQQSLHLEQRNERCPGLAADYVNLALIENLTGNPDTAAEQLKIAQEYAQKTADEELIALVNTKIPQGSDK